MSTIDPEKEKKAFKICQKLGLQRPDAVMVDGDVITCDSKFKAENTTHLAGVLSTTENLGQEWCAAEEAPGIVFRKFVAMRANLGWVLLCSVTRDVRTGKITRTPITFEELNRC